MNREQCFVIMAIGDQEINGHKLTSAELRQKYNDLIKEALLKARPSLEVIRADEVAIPGTITTDIITRIMNADFVVADVSHPNPNVFYELGLRHACRPGTIIIRDKNSPSPPFDIAHLRYIEYENTASGLKVLSSEFETYFDHFDRDSSRPDNQFLEIAKLMHYKFMDYSEETNRPEVELMMAAFSSPDFLDIFVRQQDGEEINPVTLMLAMAKDPSISRILFDIMAKNGQLSFTKTINPSE
jgi:hypothetical protein